MVFSEQGKQGLVRVTRVVVEPGSCRDQLGWMGVGADLRELAQSTLPPHLRFWPTEMPFCHTLDQAHFTDVCFMVGGQPFQCHKVHCFVFQMYCTSYCFFFFYILNVDITGTLHCSRGGLRLHGAPGRNTERGPFFDEGIDFFFTNFGNWGLPNCLGPLAAAQSAPHSLNPQLHCFLVIRTFI